MKPFMRYYADTISKAQHAIDTANFMQADKLYHELADVAAAGGSVLFAEGAKASRARALIFAGKFSLVLKLADEALPSIWQRVNSNDFSDPFGHFGKSDFMVVIGQLSICRAQAELALGRLKLAEDHSKEGVAILEANSTNQYYQQELVNAQNIRAKILLNLHRSKEALRMAQAAAQKAYEGYINGSSDFRRLYVLASLILAQVYADFETYGLARDRLATAEDQFKQLSPQDRKNVQAALSETRERIEDGNGLSRYSNPSKSLSSPAVC